MVRVRFAPSPTGTLHVGNALSAVANRRIGDWMLLRLDDTDAARNVPGGEQAIVEDLRWLGISWDDGPVRQSERGGRHIAAAQEAGLPQRFDGVMLWRDDGSPTFHLASVVDDIDFEITHVIRGSDHRPNEELHAAGSTVASLRETGYPAEAVRAYLEELELPRHDVYLDLERIRSLSVDVLAQLDDAELAARAGVPVEAAPLMRGAHDLVEARRLALSVLDDPGDSPREASETLMRFAELRDPLPETLSKDEAKAVIRELKAVGGSLKSLRLALTGAERGPELWAVLRALPRDEALRRALPS